MGARLTDYYWIQDHVKSLKTPTERIDFINPYERPWSRFEKKWHRVFHPELFEPRKSWLISPIPKYYDSLNFFKYITKTKVIEETKIMDGYYSGLVPPTKKFEKRMIESLKVFLNENEKNDKKVSELLRTIFDDAQMSISHNVDWIQKYRQSTNERCESFWIRGGFKQMYHELEVWDETGKIDKKNVGKARFVGDDHRKLGELLFTMRDQLAVQLRGKTGLKEVVEWSKKEIIESPIFDEKIDINDDVIFNPTVFKLEKDVNPLWQCPGYESDSNEIFKYGRLAIKSTYELQEQMKKWKIHEESDEYDKTNYECLVSTAITSMFNWLNGQAHCNGFTQFNDLEMPFTSQMILSDGKQFLFALGQLNTIAINVEVDGFINRKSNLCFIDGPYNLYDEYDDEKGQFMYENDNGKLVEGLNPKVMSRFLQMLMIGR